MPKCCGAHRATALESSSAHCQGRSQRRRRSNTKDETWDETAHGDGDMVTGCKCRKGRIVGMVTTTASKPYMHIHAIYYAISCHNVRNLQSTSYRFTHTHTTCKSLQHPASSEHKLRPCWDRLAQSHQSHESSQHVTTTLRHRVQSKGGPGQSLWDALGLIGTHWDSGSRFPGEQDANPTEFDVHHNQHKIDRKVIYIFGCSILLYIINIYICLYVYSF